MAQDPASKAAADFDAVVAQLAALRDDMAKLAGSLTQAGARQSQSLMNDVSEGMTEAARYVGQRGQQADARIESAVASNPYVALAVAAGVGVLLGALTRR